MKLILPPKNAFVHTNVEDPIDYYYYPFIGYFYKKRLTMVLNLVQRRDFDSILDIGYGCGILFPTLNQAAKHLYGIETHGKEKDVSSCMQKLGVHVNLIPGNILDLSSVKRKFDAMVLVSILEHVKEIDKAVEELAGLQTKGDLVFVGSPVKNRITDLVFRLFRFDYEKHHPSSHKDILRALAKKYDILKLKTFPSWAPLDYALYFSVVGRKL